MKNLLNRRRNRLTSQTRKPNRHTSLAVERLENRTLLAADVCVLDDQAVPCDDELGGDALIGDALIGNALPSAANVGTGAIHGVFFEDINGDGQRNAGEPGMDHLPVHLLNLGNDPVTLDGVVNTNPIFGESGAYVFGNVSQGTIRVHELGQPNWVSTLPPSHVASGTIGFHDFELEAGQVVANADFPSARLGSISGYKYLDFNGNGRHEENIDQPMAGVEFRLTGTTGLGVEVNTLTTTDATGRFTFVDLMPSVNGEGPATGYEVSEVVPNGFYPTTPESVRLDLRSGDHLVAFRDQTMVGETITVPLSGQLRGDRGDDERMVGPFPTMIPAGVYEVTLTSADFGAGHGSQNQTAEQFLIDALDVNGNLTFRSPLIGDLPNNVNQLTEVVHERAVISSDIAALKALHISLFGTAGTNSIDPVQAVFRPLDFNIEVLPALQFGNAEGGTVNGGKFEDIDGDAARDNDEPGLNRWAIELVDVTSGDVVATAITRTIDDVDGRYVFTGVPAGDYLVREVPPLASWTQTFPAAAPAHDGQRVHRITVTPGQQLDGVDFGNTVRGSLQGRKFEDVDGDSIYNPAVDGPMSGVSFRLTGVDGLGHVVDRLAVSDAEGRFRFDDVYPSVDGQGPATGYKIDEVVPANNEPTTPTSFSTDLRSREVFVAEAGQAMLRADGLRVEELVTPNGGWLNSPRAVALGPDDLLYVADDGSDQILRFDPRTGALIDVFVDSAANDPLGVSDPGMGLEFRDGFAYVVNDGTGQVLRYDIATGDRDTSFAATVPDAQDKTLRDLAIGPDGSLYVSHTQPGGVVRFNADGSFHSQFASGLVGARGLAVDADGNVYVVIRTSNVVKRFAPDGTFLGDFIMAAGGGPEDLAADWDFNGDDIRDWFISDSSTGSVGLYDGATGARLGELVDLPLQTPRGLFVRGLEVLVAGAASSNVVYASIDPRVEIDLGTQLMFGNQRSVGEVRGTKFIDANADGQRDLVELGMAGVVIYADINGNRVLDDEERAFSTITSDDDPSTTRTDETGGFVLTLPLGSYQIREVVPAGFHQSFPEDAHQVELVEPGQVISDQDFANAYGAIGNAFPGDIRGCKFHDFNVDGRQGPREPGLPGITIDLYQEVNGEFELVRSTVTGPDGMYEFLDLEPGRVYRVREDLRDGAIQTTPLLPDVFLFSDQTIVFGTCHAAPDDAQASPILVPQSVVPAVPADNVDIVGDETALDAVVPSQSSSPLSSSSLSLDASLTNAIVREARVTTEVVPNAGSHRAVSRQDVDADGIVTPDDVGLIVTSIRSDGPRSIDPQDAHSGTLDVNGDRWITSLDVLLVVNVLNLSADLDSALTNDAEAEDAAEQPTVDAVWQLPVGRPPFSPLHDATDSALARPLHEWLGEPTEVSRTQLAVVQAGREFIHPARADNSLDDGAWDGEWSRELVDESLLDDLLLPAVERTRR